MIDDDRDVLDRVVGVWAGHHAAIARALRAVVGEVGVLVEPFVDGALVLTGPGRYVNAACGAGRVRPPTDDEWRHLVRCADTIGVRPAIEVSDVSHPGTVEGAVDRGWTEGGRRRVFVRPLADPGPTTTAGSVPRGQVREVAADRIVDWQAASALGVGLVTDAERRVGDEWVAAAYAAGDRLFVAYLDDAPVGAATLHVRDGVATLGGMSTAPAARRRGVQAHLIAVRLAAAVSAGCDLAASNAVADDSARNLLRAGFVEIGALTEMAPPPSDP